MFLQYSLFLTLNSLIAFDTKHFNSNIFWSGFLDVAAVFEVCKITENI